MCPSTCPVPLLSSLPDFSGHPSTVPLQEELWLLSMQLDRHISTHIRESPQAMHWTKLKDLATQTNICWQELLTHCRPQVVPSCLQTWEGREVVRQLTRARAQPPHCVYPHCSC